ncbi:ribosome modulation factor [Bermanella sp. R86510]|uniref:ribosome modulation factor n=1 Tax=unclassified Bermanella TaxID=2627862 RepID=UPI0037CAF989
MELVENHWDLENLEKAYRHGFMAGMVGKAIASCPYRAEMVVTAWEAGWQDGKEQFDIKHGYKQTSV